MFSAGTARAVIINCDVAALSRCARAAVVDFPVKNHAGSDSSSESHIKNDSISASGAPAPLGEGCSFGVVVQNDSAVVNARDFFDERVITPARHVGGIE